MTDVFAPIRPRIWHRKRKATAVPPADVRTARRGQVHPREYRCGLRCGLLFRYAHKGEIPSDQCHVTRAAHEFLLCPAHPQFPICVLHSASFSEAP